MGTRRWILTTFCRTTLNYAAPAGAQPGARGEVDVEIRDGRTADLPGWRECGFELVRHTSGIKDWTDDAEISMVHYDEAEAVARAVTGCDFALVSDHVKRTADGARREREQSPVRLVHSDFAADYADRTESDFRLFTAAIRAGTIDAGATAG